MLLRGILIAALMFGGITARSIAQVDPQPALQTAPPEPVLTGRPDAAAPNGAEDLLGDTFDSLGAGISFRAPAGWKEIRTHRGDEIVQYVDEADRTTLTVNHLDFDPPVQMSLHKEPNSDGKGQHDVNGLFEETIEHLKTDAPGIQFDRKDVVQMPTPDGWTMDVGFIAGRFRAATDDNVAMIALVRLSPPDKNTTSASRVYYSFNLTAPVTKGQKPEDDPVIHKLASTFNQVIDSVRLLDQSPIRDEQNRRLFATRSLLVNLTPERIRQALVPEQWLRLIRDGKDIGYTYIVEETARDLPRRGQTVPQSTGADGVLIGVRTRSTPAGASQVDSESWMWSAFDRRTEKWTNFSLVHGSASGEDRFSEIGSTNTQIKLLREQVGDKQMATGEQFGKDAKDNDPNQPAVRQVEVTTLEVVSKGKERTAAPFSQELPPWYLPQSLGHLLPRLVAKFPPKQYMFAFYTRDNHAIMARYIDVDDEAPVELAGQHVRAIVVRDRLGYEGSITSHYISPSGQYLGSVNEDSKITVLASDRATLETMWKNANLTRPGEVEEKP